MDEINAFEGIKTDWEKAHRERYNAVPGKVFGWQWGGQTVINQMIELGAFTHLKSPVVEIGCGGGKWTRVLVDQGLDVIALDVHDPAIEETSERVPEARVIKTNGEDIPLRRGQAGSVFSFGTFLHLPPELVCRYFQEAARVATHSIVFQIPDMVADWGCKKFLRKVRARQWHKPYHFGYMNYYVPEMMFWMLKIAGWPHSEVIGHTGITGPRDMIVVGRKKL